MSMRSETDLSLQTVVILGLPLRQTDSTFLQQRYETVFYYHSFTLIILEFMRLRRNLLQT